MTRFALVAAAVALAVVAAGCGGSSSTSEQASGTPTTTATTSATGGSGGTATTTTESSSSETTTTAASSRETGTTGDTSTTGSGTGAVPARCLEFATAAAKLSEALAASGGALGESDSLKRYFSGVAAKAPASIRKAFETLADAIGRYVEALEAANVKPGSAPTADALAKLQKALKEIDNAEVRQASAKIEAWVKAGCE